MHVRNLLPSACGAFGLGLGAVLMAGSASASTGINATAANATSSRDAAMRIAQVNNANLACYLYDFEGVQYDLGVLCANDTKAEATGEGGLSPTTDESSPLEESEIENSETSEESLDASPEESEADVPTIPDTRPLQLPPFPVVPR